MLARDRSASCSEGSDGDEITEPFGRCCEHLSLRQRISGDVVLETKVCDTPVGRRSRAREVEFSEGGDASQHSIDLQIERCRLVGEQLDRRERGDSLSFRGIDPAQIVAAHRRRPYHAEGCVRCFATPALTECHRIDDTYDKMRRALDTHGENGPPPEDHTSVSSHQQRAISSGDEVAIVVHEVQNALSSALFSVDVARRTTDIAERTRALATIERTIERARSMMTALADPALRFSVQCSTLRMSAIVEELAALLRPRCEASGVKLNVQSSGDPKAFGDADRVVQVLTNLVLNALDAIQALPRRTPDRGVITLVARATDDASEFVVTDDGVGMSDATLARLWETGFTTHPRAEGARKAGSGFGMSVSRTLAHAMSGDLRVRSTEGRGSEISLVLPRGEVVSAPAPSRNRIDDLPAGLRVLVVDDEPSIRELLVTALSLRGASVSAAASSDAARLILAREPFDVALVDETLGATDRGAPLVEELLDRYASTTVLLMTGAPTVEHLPPRVVRCLLRKPFSLDEAVRTILRARDGEST